MYYKYQVMSSYNYQWIQSDLLHITFLLFSLRLTLCYYCRSTVVERSKSSNNLDCGWDPRFESRRGEIYFPTQTRSHTFESKRGCSCKKKRAFSERWCREYRVVPCRGTGIKKKRLQEDTGEILLQLSLTCNMHYL